MSKISQLNQKLHIQEQSCLWISRLDRELAPEEVTQLSDWLNESPKHHEALLEMARFWDDLTVLNQLNTLFPLAQQTKHPKTGWSRMAIAASIALMTLLSANLLFNEGLFSLDNQSELANNRSISTKIGEQANYILTDGTKIHLNTDSIVQVSYSQNHRKISLIQGEASFDVAKDKTRPFTVTAGLQSFTALGTIFNVQKSDDKAMELLVSEGRVLITKADESIAKITKLIATQNTTPLAGTLVTAGQKAVIKSNINAPVVEVPLEQLQRDLAWQQGMLIFEGEPLEQALIEVGRYTSTKFEISDPQLAELKVAGYFKAGDIDGLLSSLNSNFNIVTNRNKHDVIELTLAN